MVDPGIWVEPGLENDSNANTRAGDPRTWDERMVSALDGVVRATATSWNQWKILGSFFGSITVARVSKVRRSSRVRNPLARRRGKCSDTPPTSARGAAVDDSITS